MTAGSSADGKGVTNRAPGERVAVVGAGISGLLSAALLARQGRSVTLVDQALGLGGLLGSIRHGDQWFDQGTHVPQELGHAELDDLLFGGLDERGWRRIEILRAGHVVGGGLTAHTPFPSLHGLGPTAHDRAVVEMLACGSPGEGHPTSAEELRATFGATITDQIFRPAVQRFFGRDLDVLAPGAHRILFNRVVALDGPTTVALKAAVPHLDATLAFHRPEDGPNRAAWYPTDGGCGRWVDHVADRHLGGVDVALGAGVEKVAGRDDGSVRSLLLDDGSELEVDAVVWTLPPSRFLLAAGIDPPAGARPELLPVHLHHLVLDRESATDAHYVTVLDPDRETNRVTIYPNLRGGGPASCTIERVGEREPVPPQALAEELVALGIAATGTRVVEAHEDLIAAGFPVPTPASATAALAATEAAEAATTNATFLGRTTGRSFFMTEVLTEAHAALTP